MGLVPRMPPSPPGQCPSPGRSWPLSLQDSQLCCRHLGWLPGLRAHQAGQVGTPAGKVRPGEGETWLGFSGACGQGQQLRETGFSSERGGGGGCRWGVGGIPPPSDPRPCLVPGLPPGCEAWVPGGLQAAGVLALVPGSLSEPRGLPSVPRGPLPRLSPAVPGHCPSSPAPSPGPDISALQVGEGVARAPPDAPELAGARLLPAALGRCLCPGAGLCHLCPYARLCPPSVWVSQPV